MDHRSARVPAGLIPGLEEQVHRVVADRQTPQPRRALQLPRVQTTVGRLLLEDAPCCPIHPPFEMASAESKCGKRWVFFLGGVRQFIRRPAYLPRSDDIQAHIAAWIGVESESNVGLERSEVTGKPPRHAARRLREFERRGGRGG